MSLDDIKLIGDTGWMPEPRYAPQDVLDSDGTVMHALSSPSPKRTIVGHFVTGAAAAYAGLVATAQSRTATSFAGESCYILTVVGQRIQNIGAEEIWRVTVEIQQFYE